MMLKVCYLCNKEFNARKKTSKYCSTACQYESQKKVKEQKSCLCCGCVFTPKPGSTGKYCTQSCAAQVNNRKFPKRKKQNKPNNCPECNKEISFYSEYCIDCYQTARKDNLIKAWLNGTWRGGTDYSLSDIVRQYLLKINNYECSLCSFSGFHALDGKTILTIDHINGDGTDHRPDNVRVLCPNCHALTDSYCGRNKGKGRPLYYSRKLKIEGLC